MELETVKMALAAVNMLGTAGIWVYLRIEKKSDKTNERLDALAGAVERLNREMARVESEAHAAPTHDDLAKVYGSVSELSKTVHQMVGEFRANGDTLRLILNKITQSQ